MLRWEFRAVGRAKQLNGRIYGQGFDRSGPIGVHFGFRDHHLGGRKLAIRGRR